MSVIVELILAADEFELGRILGGKGNIGIVLETMVPLGERPVPFVRLQNADRRSFEQRVRNHPAVNDIHVVDTHGDETLYALDWQFSGDAFLEGILAMDVQMLEATGSRNTWSFRLRFPSHESFSTFRDHCFESDIELNVKQLYNPTRPDAGPWYGLTMPQRKTLMCAVRDGYYSIPRQISTDELATQFDVSDQAVTERLRRAISTLVTNTLLLSEHDS